MSESYDAKEPQPTRPAGRPPVNPGSFGPPAPPAAPPVVIAAPTGGRILTRILGTLLIVSLIANLYMGVLLSRFMGQSNYATLMEGDPNYRIVVLPVVGMIDDSTSGRVRAVLQDLRQQHAQNKGPKAVILRVDSGGGTVGASDRIWHDLVAFRAETGIPIVASFGSVAASGGYYIAASADHIFAEPTCVTGSIGVMANVMTFERLLDKLGVTPEVLVAEGSPKKDVANNVFRPWNETDRAKVQTILDGAHARFVEVVSKGRSAHLTVEEVTALANGDVYTASQALEHKLIDAEGYLQDAVAQAAALAKLPTGVEPQVEVYQERSGLFISWVTASERSHVRNNGLDLSALDGETLRRTLVELTTPRLEYRINLAP